jgi:opacity protein-like surface antigen
MKKITIVLLAVILVTSMGFSAVKKSSKKAEKPGMIVFGDVGLAVSDFKGLFIDAGIQYGLSENLFGEFLFDFYLDPAGKHGDVNAYGFNLNGVYKHPLQDNLNLFGKAGVNLTMVSGGGGSDFGLNAGGGVEYKLSDNMGIRGGATFKLIFSEGESGNFFKFYGGFFYGL